jgi:hypothetical protein
MQKCLVLVLQVMMMAARIDARQGEGTEEMITLYGQFVHNIGDNYQTGKSTEYFLLYTGSEISQATELVFPNATLPQLLKTGAFARVSGRHKSLKRNLNQNNHQIPTFHVESASVLPVCLHNPKSRS